MIRLLAVHNLAVIESVTVRFEPAFNVLTGETGAGKSILVEAVGLLLGGRATQDLVRTGEQQATVEAVFDTPDRGELTLRREVTAQGRSRAFIDGSPATAGALKDLASQFVELHGQHEHHVLLDPEQHLAILDEWGALSDLRQRVSGAFARISELRQQIDRRRMDDRERAARLELVEFQLGELTRTELTPGEDERLAATRQVLRSAERIHHLCRTSWAELYEDDGAVLGALDRVWKRVAELGTLVPEFAPYLDARGSITSQLEDLAFALRDFISGLDTSPARLQEVEDRLALLERLKRRYGPTLADVIARRDSLAAERASLTGGGASLGELEAELARASRDFLAQARDLSARRGAAASRFAGGLRAELADLAMTGARVEVRLLPRTREDEWSAQGLEQAELYLSANLGEEPRPLARVASGGELSRIMLALKTLGRHSGLPVGQSRTLIFDEVDAGIGGRVASVVGRKLADVARHHQVLCITHLPQVAACADTHFLIDKQTRAGRTVTSVHRLDADARVDELARMMGGAAAGVQARAGARELLAATRAKGETAPKAKGERSAERKL